MFARETARVAPDRPAVVHGTTGEVMTYRELEDSANQLAWLMRDQGLRPGDHIAVFMENGLDLIVVDSAAERTGLYYTNIGPQSTVGEASYLVDNSTARIVVVSERVGAVAREVRALCPRVERWLILSDAPPAGFESYADAVAKYGTDSVPDERLGIAMLYSSGTTGRPKGILRALPDLRPDDPLPIWKSAGDIYHMREGNIFLATGPMHHGQSQVPAGLTIRLGGTVVMMERFDAERFLQLIDAYKVTHTVLVPTMMSRMLALPEEVRHSYSVESLESVFHSAAPCPETVKRAMIEWFGPVISETYGGSEGNGIVTCSSPEWLAKPGTVGKAIVGEVIILDENGNECPPRTIGNVWFRGATNFTYFGDEEKTKQVRDESASMSTLGDIGYLDEDGYLFLTDRTAFTIVSGGVNIYPQEIENILADHPDVADVAVLGVPDADKGEVVKAVVALRPGVETIDATAERLIAYCDGRLSRYKWPRSVDFVDEVPRNATGKVDKRVLKARYWDGRTSMLL